MTRGPEPIITEAVLAEFGKLMRRLEKERDMHDAHTFSTESKGRLDDVRLADQPKHRRPTAAKSRFKSRPKPRRSKR